MADWLSREQRSRNMASIRSKGNRTTEWAFRQLLREARISGWRRHVDLPGKPDFAFRLHRLAVFIDGCFWHGCPRCYRLPEDNRGYWKAKVDSNRARDRRRTRELRLLNWRVLRIWEHALESPSARRRAVAKLLGSLRQLVSGVVFTNGKMTVKLADSRELSVPLECFPRLQRASARERRKWELIGGGLGIHWPLIDEDISVENLLAPRPQRRRRAPSR